VEDIIIEDASCPHQRARLVFDPNGAELDDDTSPLVVRLDDQGRTTVVTGWAGNFNPSPIGYAWRHFGDVEKVCRYLAIMYGARAEFVGVPDPRTFAFVVVAHPGFVAEFGGEGEEAPDKKWIAQAVAQAVKEVTAYAEGEAWAVVAEQAITGKQIRFYDHDRSDDVEDFQEWEETERLGGYLDYDYAKDEAERYLAGEVLDCKKRRAHGA